MSVEVLWHLLTQYYGVDILAMYLGNKAQRYVLMNKLGSARFRQGCLCGSISSACWISFGVFTGSLGSIIASSAALNNYGTAYLLTFWKVRLLQRFVRRKKTRILTILSMRLRPSLVFTGKRLWRGEAVRA